MNDQRANQYVQAAAWVSVASVVGLIGGAILAYNAVRKPS